MMMIYTHLGLSLYIYTENNKREREREWKCANVYIYFQLTVVIVGDEYFKRDGQWEETPDIYTALLVCATGRQRRNSWLE